MTYPDIAILSFLLLNLYFSFLTLRKKDSVTYEIKEPEDSSLLIRPFLAVQTLIQHFQAIDCLEGEVAARSCGQHLFNSPNPKD